MPKFEVKRRVDAYIDYIAEVEAESPEEAAQLAQDDEDSYKWEACGEAEFDGRIFITLDKNGTEIDGTQCGDF
jgi:hypothetical protein